MDGGGAKPHAPCAPIKDRGYAPVAPSAPARPIGKLLILRNIFRGRVVFWLNAIFYDGSISSIE